MALKIIKLIDSPISALGFTLFFIIKPNVKNNYTIVASSQVLPVMKFN
jgi:hypothetical protein